MDWRAPRYVAVATHIPGFLTASTNITRTRAPPSRSIFAVASPMPLVPPMITARFSPYHFIGRIQPVSATPNVSASFSAGLINCKV
ncbi:hypothetical protein LMG22931_06917 [Paraburkholderia nemoris]|nr:hypothetical protein LMG22931_06917 [Paraburkholderia nemoris]